MERIYLDHASAMPVEQRVLAFARPYLEGRVGNPSSSHSVGTEAKEALEEAREKVAALINAPEPKTIIFTSGATEANNLAIKGAALRSVKKGRRLVAGAIEHMSVLNPMKELTKSGFEMDLVEVDSDGLVSLERLALPQKLAEKGVETVVDSFRERGATVPAGLTGANFGIATTGTVVLESTDEAVRITSTLPEKHFVLLDPEKIVEGQEQTVELMRQFHEQLPQAYLAYLTGPSRTADIERVLTIGVHGPRELHILLMSGVSNDPMER